MQIGVSHPSAARHNSSDSLRFWNTFRRGELKSAYYYEDHLVSEESRDLGVTGVIPSDGRVRYVDYYFVVRGTRHRDLAEAWINYLISAQKQQEWMIAHWASVARLRPGHLRPGLGYYATRWKKEVLGR